MMRFFSKKDKTSIKDQPSVVVQDDFSIEERQPLERPKKMTLSDEKKLYHANPSIIDYLPWAEYLDDEQCLLLDDGISVGAVYAIEPVPTEGRPESRLEEIRDTVEDALQDSLEEYDENPWVVQFFCQDESNVTDYLNRLRSYVRPAAQGTKFTEVWLRETEKHLQGIARPEGLFDDTLVTGQPWRGQQRRTRMVVYRWLGKNHRDPMPPIGMLNQVCDRLSSALGNAGVICVRQNGYQVHDWLLRLFNPEPDWVDKQTLYREGAYWSKQDEQPNNLEVHNDFAETLWFTPPRSDTKNGVWWFDNKAHGVVNVERLRKAPNPGLLTGEQRRGDRNINTLMDLFPEGTIVSITIVVQPQDTLEEKFTKLSKNAVGENTESGRVREDVKIVKEYLGRRHKLYRASLSFLLRAGDIEELNRKRIEITSTLLTAGLEPVKPEYDVAPLNGYLRALPMCFNPQFDKKHWYTRLSWVQHLSGLLPVTGRSTGTGNPGFSFFNRGGDVLTFDPQNKNDRSQNAHLLLFGPTGAGKSATLCSVLSQLVAVHRPRLFIAEAGNSFGLLADYFESLGLSVHKISVKPGSKVSLPPFADAHKLLQADIASLELEDLPDINADEENEERDILGEMEIAARMMITGGEPDEEKRLTRADRGMIREAILLAAKNTFEQKRQMLAEDLQSALNEISGDFNRDERRRARAAEMAEAMSLFTQGFEGELFNQPGVAWPEADITLIDLAHLAREGYEAAMALTMVSLINTINNIAERDQYLERDINFVVDEAHILTTNPLLSPYMTKVVKMWRKLGAWLWLATQNLEDYPSIAAKMLNMAEWWVCLTMPQKEIEDIARFKTLSEDQKAVLRSASKLPRCYTEGVVLSKKVEALFRAVPPSLFLALGMTEKEEKAERRELMKKHNCSELEAAFLVAAKLDKARGLPYCERSIGKVISEC
ncbi:conjugative transfer ATPase [Xenorhabdus budapestensis]|uniref:Conjugative transfer ATPase n=2 Tax=Xenorhabdus budapestensis TaxID=290110 RepID=A0ABX7VF80_XENBU|nr:conjugative transfer ATPase [Xenorhabdus budapestensis]QTL39115.1 conjugative transfer ATPase [Xenorhabdus budapestensis]